jgi:hypothetical protein
MIAAGVVLLGEGPGDVGQPEWLGRQDVPAAACLGYFEGESVRGGDVACVDRCEAQARQSGQLAGEQLPDDVDRDVGAWSVDWPEDEAWVQCDQFESQPAGLVPGCTLGQRLALGVRLAAVGD